MPESAPLPPGAKPDPAPHAREAGMEAAGAELVAMLAPWITRHALTAVEYLYLLGVAQHRQVQALCLQERAHVAARDSQTPAPPG